MFKELILAIIFGGLIGFGATGTFIALKKNRTPPTVPPVSQAIPTISMEQNSISVTPTYTSTKNLITILQPQNESVVSSSSITIKGQAENQAVIIFTTVDNSYSTIADFSGNFDININLSPGINHIKIVSISPSDFESNTELFVTYSTAKI